MMNGISMRVVQPGEVRGRVGELSLAEVMPHVSALRLVEAVRPATELHMQLLEHGLQVGGIVR